MNFSKIGKIIFIIVAVICILIIFYISIFSVHSTNEIITKQTESMDIKICIPASHAGEFVYSDEKISTSSDTLTLSIGEGLVEQKLFFNL
ncbi:MAG: hypothetical protein ATN33_00360 [Epulopiscium sp. Nele67-Bin001]|nr:MAG: hypothetical protein ATN33_00360 [Epulopiscium sp. Nele67-Bin001]